MHSKQKNFRIIGYVMGNKDIYRMGVDKLTHINYAFAHVSNDGDVIIPYEGGHGHIAQLQALKAVNPRLKVILSVGGWGADNFSDAALTEQSRQRFAHSGVEIMKHFAFDGIDIDWEYPGQEGPGIVCRPEDKQNFTLMLAEMRRQVDALSDERGRAADDRYTVTIASADREYFDHTEMNNLHAHLDWINIMSYDYHGSLTPLTGHHTALYPSGSGGSDVRSTESAVRQHLAAGIPPEKLVVGVAFYGRGWAGVSAENKGLHQPYEKYAGDYPYKRLVSEVLNQNGFQREWDAEAKAPYLWNPDTGTVISYDDPESLREKAAFVKEHNLGGVMYWEHSHDPSEVLLNAIYESLNA